MIFAAKTTASALIALLIGFALNLDQPQWALLTVFIVAQPQSGLVLAKSFYRIIGTLVGAAFALVFVALFAQEGVLFLGALALWIGVCTFGSQYVRNFAAYGCVLSGYSVAIIGIPGALDPANAFYIAVARITEISLGVIVTALISHIVLPESLAATLWQGIADLRAGLADYAANLLRSGHAAHLREKLLGEVIAIENLRASAVFEGREIRKRTEAIRLFLVALIDAIGVAQLLNRNLDGPGRRHPVVDTAIEHTIHTAGDGISSWQAGAIDAGALDLRLRQAAARLPSLCQVCASPASLSEATVRLIAVVARLDEFFKAIVDCAKAYDNLATEAQPARSPVAFRLAHDFSIAAWSGLRAALAIVLVGAFWILTDWPHGSTAVILASVATSRLATMGHAVPIAIVATLVFGLMTIPAFVVIDTLLPLASGYEAFALVVAPVLFACALLMANRRSLLIGFQSALLFSAVGNFQNKMVYNPVALLNTAIAVVFAASVALVLWAVIAPETPEAARRRFTRVARKELTRILAPGSCISLVGFETAMTDALGQLQGYLRPDRSADIAMFEGGIALLGAGRALIRLREDPGTAAFMESLERDIAQFIDRPYSPALRRARAMAVRRLAALRKDLSETAPAQAVARQIVAITAIRDELVRGRALLTGDQCEPERRRNAA